MPIDQDDRKKAAVSRAQPAYPQSQDPRLLNRQEPQSSLDPAMPLSSNSDNVNRCYMERGSRVKEAWEIPLQTILNRYFYYVNRHCVFEEGGKLHRGYQKKKEHLFFFGLSCGFPIPQRTLGETVSFYRGQDLHLSHSRSCQWLVGTRTQDPDFLRWEGKRRLNLSILQWRWVQYKPLWDPQGFHSATWAISVPPQKTHSLIPRHLLELVDRPDLFIFYYFF